MTKGGSRVGERGTEVEALQASREGVGKGDVCKGALPRPSQFCLTHVPRWPSFRSSYMQAIDDNAFPAPVGA